MVIEVEFLDRICVIHVFLIHLGSNHQAGAPVLGGGHLGPRGLM